MSGSFGEPHIEAHEVTHSPLAASYWRPIEISRRLEKHLRCVGTWPPLRTDGHAENEAGERWEGWGELPG